MRYIVVLLFSLFFLSGNAVIAQEDLFSSFHFSKKGMRKLTIPFQQFNNLIILKAFINESDTLNFILDSGVSHTIITSPAIAEKLNLPQYRNISLFGSDKSRPLAAYVSNVSLFKIDKMVSYQYGLIVLKNELDYLSSYAGLPIHGLIGYDLLNSFITSINYDTREVTFYTHNSKIAKDKGTSVDLYLHGLKPYIDAITKIRSEDSIKVRLLIDTGAGSALSLQKESHPSIQVPEVNVRTNLGTALGGSLYGSIGRINEIQIGKYTFNQVITSFPDSAQVKLPADIEIPQGSVGYSILNRFKVTFDYRNKKLYLLPNKKEIKKPFDENGSGIYVSAEAPDYKVYKISYLMPNSPGLEAGLSVGDTIIAIDNFPASQMTMSKLYKLIHKQMGKKVKMFVLRDSKFLYLEFRLHNFL